MNRLYAFILKRTLSVTLVSDEGIDRKALLQGIQGKIDTASAVSTLIEYNERKNHLKLPTSKLTKASIVLIGALATYKLAHSNVVKIITSLQTPEDRSLKESDPQLWAEEQQQRGHLLM